MNLDLHLLAISSSLYWFNVASNGSILDTRKTIKKPDQVVLTLKRSLVNYTPSSLQSHYYINGVHYHKHLQQSRFIMPWNIVFNHWTEAESEDFFKAFLVQQDSRSKFLARQHFLSLSIENRDEKKKTKMFLSKKLKRSMFSPTLGTPRPFNQVFVLFSLFSSLIVQLS